MLLQFLIAWLATRINRHQDHVIAYLREENRILKTKLHGKRMVLTDTERRRLAMLAHPIERKRLKDVSTIATQLSRSEVEAALRDCDVIEDYPATHRPLPDCLVLGRLASTHPIHAVIAIDEPGDRMFVVTAYRPSAERWEDDWRTRK